MMNHKPESGFSPEDAPAFRRLRDRRLARRRRELRMTDISLAVGYEDQSYFTKVFKRVAGMLPREYREKILVSRKD